MFRLFCFMIIISVNICRASDLEGQWISGCHVKENRPSVGLLKFEDDTLTENWNYFNDESCNEPSMTVVIKLKIDFLEKLDNAPIKVDDTLEATYMIIRDTNPKVVSYFNEQNFCGHSDWKVGELVDVTGAQSCGLPSKGTKFYSILGVGNETIFVAKTTQELDGSSPEKRPEELNLETPFLRVFE